MAALSSQLQIEAGNQFRLKELQGKEQPKLDLKQPEPKPKISF